MAKSTPRPGSWGRSGKAGTRYVRTPEGAEKYGLPIGAPITADAVARAKARGRGYTVPEDDARFGSKPPAAGRTRRTSSEVVNSIRTGPAPRKVTPDGPKKIAIGDKGFSFPEGSRAFRSEKYQNFAIVRTPDYQLVGITDKGNAFEFEGELERELNEELDDDRSAVWIPDEPNPNLGEAEASEGDGPNVDSFRPDNLEDMPGYLSDERINEIADGLRAAGLDDNAVNAAELELRRNNERIEQEFAQADAPGGPDGTEPDAPEADVDQPRQPEMDAAPVPDRQPDLEEAPARPPVPSKPAAKAAQVREQRARDNTAASAKPSSDQQLADLEELSRKRPTGTAEGDVNGRRVSVRRNRVNDSMEYSSDNESFANRDDVVARTQSPPEPDEPRDTTDLDASELGDQELEDVLADIDDALRAGMISRREARQRRKDLAAERERRGAEVPEEPAEREEPEAPEVVEGMPAPGEPTTQDFAEKAQPGSAATTSDGMLVTRTEDGWESPLGTVGNDFVGESDVESDITVVARNAPEADGRPVGATRKLGGIDDFEDVRPADSVVFTDSAGSQFTGTRHEDGTFRLEMQDGLAVDGIPAETLAASGLDMWHVPNQDFQTPSKERWSIGDKLRSMGDLLAQKIGTRLRMRGNGRNERDEDLIVVGQGRVQTADNIRLPGSSLKPALATNRVSISSVPESEMTESDIAPPRQISDLAQYRRGDQISDYRHLREMEPGQQVTLTVPASQNGGREAMVVLTRTRDEEDFGGFMFLVGDGGRGYNSFGENNASLFQAIHDGRLQFGNLRSGISKKSKIFGADWGRDKTIEAWDGGPKVSEYDLRTFIASQVASRAMQGAYFNTSLLPDDSPFRSKAFRDAFAQKAIEKYSVEGNPARHKPAMIRLAAEKLGIEYTDPGSTLIPDNLTLEDFNRRVTLGRWLRSTGTSAEANMGPEQIDVTAADIKTALAVLDNMQQSDDQGDPDKILKRVFARQGSPLQDLNVAVAIASYFRMKRYKDGQGRAMTTIARQYDKRRNRELLRQMLREQLEGREPGYYGIPEDETYERNGQTFHNRSSLRAPAPDTSVAPVTEEVVEPEVAVPEEPLDRMDVLDDYDNVRDAFLDARQQGDSVAYIREVLGEEEIARMNSGQGSIRQSFTRAWNQRNGVAEADTPATPEAPAAPERAFPMEPSRRQELDQMSWEDAWRDAQAKNDVLNYIEDVMGPEGVSALNDGSVSMRAQFVRAFEQANPDTYMEGRAPAPANTSPSRGETVDAARIEELPVGSVILYPRRSGGTSRYTRRADGWYTERGNQVRGNPAEWNTRFTVESTPDAPAERVPDVSSTPRTAETTAGDPRFAQGGSFRGSDIRQAPVGSHVRGASGREYRVTETGIHGLGSDTTYHGFPVVERLNAQFTFVGDTAPDEPVSAIAQTMPDSRIGASFDPTDLMSLPRDSFVRSSTGTMWRIDGTYLTSVPGGQRRRIRNLRPGTYTFLGDSPASVPTQRTATASAGRTLEQAGLSRVPQDVVERYDIPRALPEVRFDTADSRDWATMARTDEGIRELQKGLRAALKGALPEGTVIDVSAGPAMFTASYTTPDGKSGSMTRVLRGNGRIENAVAHAGGANFAAVQDHLFAFYRQHGLTEVEVHGLSSRGWNGAHTWIRRGFRPDPQREVQNFSAFSKLRDNLSRIVQRTERGEFPNYTEFLDEAKDLSRRMTELLNERQNLTLDERNDRLYRMWRELTYLGEVRDASGQTARGARRSIGWLLLGNQSSETWYYGLRNLDDYFQN
jgi:hypothetical protein